MQQHNKTTQKIIDFDDVTQENIKEHNLYWSQFLDHLYRILMIGGSESGKTKSSFNPISQQPDADEIYLYVKDPYEAKYQFLINKQETTGLKRFNDSQMIWMIFLKILKNTIQTRKVKHQSYHCLW